MGRTRDLEQEMLDWLTENASEVKEVVVRRSPMADGTELTEINPRDERGAEHGGPVLQTGHAEIVRILRSG
jgi:hypothetical protein